MVQEVSRVGGQFVWQLAGENTGAYAHGSLR